MPNPVQTPEQETQGRSVGTPWWPSLLGACAFLLVLWLLPRLQTSGLEIKGAERLALETQIRDTWAKILWSGVTLAAAALVWRSLNALTKVVQNSNETLAAAERNAYFASQAAATERYARAMTLLGDERVEVRLGAIYALERLARESQADHGAIMEVLAAFVREHAMWLDGETIGTRTPADIQAILSVLGRRHSAFDVADFHLDLHGVTLPRAYMPHANLRGAFLYESNLEGALLQGADLRGSWMWKTDFRDTQLQGALLQGADLTGAANLTAEQLRQAHFDETTKLPEHLRGIRESRASQAPAEEEFEVDPEDLKLPTRQVPV